MTNLIDDAEAAAKAAGTAASPYLIYAKIAGIALVILAIAAAGWWARGRFDGTAVAQAKLQTAQCGTARATDRANANAGAAQDLAAGADRARAADNHTSAQEGKRAAGYQAALQEVNHAPPSPASVSVDPEPLRQLFIGMRNADAAASAGPDSDGTPPAADH